MRVLADFLLLKNVGLGRSRSFAIAVCDPGAHIPHRILGQPGRIRAHVGDEAGGALVAQLDALVQALASAMVRLGEKRSLLDASCCKREVMKGGGGFLATLLALHMADSQRGLRD